MDLNNLSMVRLQDRTGKWQRCTPFVASVRGGKAVIYATDDGTEIKREPLARYIARTESAERMACMDDATESDKAVWFVCCVESTAEELKMTVGDTAELLDKYGLAKWALDGYGSFHTNTFEYMAF